MKPIKERMREREERQAYYNRRAQLYGDLSAVIDPGSGRELPFAIPARFVELRRQLSIMPRTLDSEGRLRLPPKRRKKGSQERSLEEILGCSPDEADSLVLAVHGMMHGDRRRRNAGVIRSSAASGRRVMARAMQRIA